MIWIIDQLAAAARRAAQKNSVLLGALVALGMLIFGKVAALAMFWHDDVIVEVDRGEHGALSVKLVLDSDSEGSS